MSTLVLDIETIGEAWEELDQVTKSALTRWIDRSIMDEIQKAAALSNIKDSLGLSPLTGRIIAIGLYDIERQQGVIYYTGEGKELDEIVGEYTLKQRSEHSMLEEFWDGARHYDAFVTFSGRSFDAPFLIHRSLIHGLLPSKNLMEGRYPYQQKSCRHIDLQDELTFFGAMQKRPSLHLFCRAYGIGSSKTGIGGSDVAELFQDKKFRDIALYNSRDVTATAELYSRWNSYRQNLIYSEDLGSD